MSEWRKIWANGLPNEGRSPKSGHRMAAEGMEFPWRWTGGTISTNLDVIWEMSDEFELQRGPVSKAWEGGGEQQREKRMDPPMLSASSPNR